MKMIKFDNAFCDVTKHVVKIPSGEYLKKGRFPIVDQGDRMIAGYTNREDGLFTDVPVVLFGDHTRVFKFIDFPFFAGADGTKVLKAKDGTDAHFAYYSFRNSPVLSMGYSRHFKMLKGMPFLTHDLPVQRRIAKVLSVLDDKIALNRKKIDKLEALAKTIYDYWFVQFDFPDANGRPYKSSGGKMVYNPILKREIPDGWEVVPFSQCIDFTMGQSPTGETLNETKNGTLFYQGATDFGTYFPTPRQYTTKPIRMAKAGDILLSVRAPVGTVNIADSECCIGRGLGAFRSRRTRKGSLFVWLYLKGLETYFARKNSVGTTFGSIGKEDFALLPVLKPDELLIEEFEGIDKHLMGEMMVANNEIRNLTSLRDFLLPLLMNGQVEVGE